MGWGLAVFVLHTSCAELAATLAVLATFPAFSALAALAAALSTFADLRRCQARCLRYYTYCLIWGFAASLAFGALVGTLILFIGLASLLQLLPLKLHSLSVWGSAPFATAAAVAARLA